MKYILYTLIFISLSVGSTDISYRDIEFREENAWKYGVKPSKKVIEDKVYLSIKIDERLLCEPKSVSLFTYTSLENTHETEVKIHDGLYYASTNISNYMKAEFWIRCKNRSKVHQASHFVFIAWEKNA